METTNWQDLRSTLYDHLTCEVMPFWTTATVDRNHGGVFTFLRDDGSIVDHNKSVISNARALWTFSAMARRYDHAAQWAEFADSTYSFLITHCYAGNGNWNFLVQETGACVMGPRTIMTGAFAIYGLVEYYRLRRDPVALRIAVDTYRTCRQHLQNPGTYNTILYPTPRDMLAHRESMQFSLVCFELGTTTGDESILEDAIRHSDNVLNTFYREDQEVLLEYVAQNGMSSDTPEGRAMVPGHGIESLWFQIRLRTSPELDDKTSAIRAARAMRSCLERGWDQEHGGLFLGIDVAGKEPAFWKLADTKRWWPHCEALCGTLMAYEQLGEQWCVDWYWRVHEWTLNHFPNSAHGEWFQNLNRYGEPFSFEGKTGYDIDLKRLSAQTGASETWLRYDFLVKDPFHLPRALIFAIETLDRITEKREQAC